MIYECAGCGKMLGDYTVIVDNRTTPAVELCRISPCSVCLENAKAVGFHDGYREAALDDKRAFLMITL